MKWVRIKAAAAYGFDRVEFDEEKSGFFIYGKDNEYIGIGRLDIYQDRKLFTNRTWLEYGRRTGKTEEAGK